MEKKNGQKLIKHVKGLFSDKCKSTGSIDFVFPPRKHESSDMCWISGNMANVDLEKVVPDVESSTMPKIKKNNKIGNPGMRNFATNILVLTYEVFY
jgi:hypothetical protein